MPAERDYLREGRIITGVFVAACLIGLIAYNQWKSEPTQKDTMTPEETACLDVAMQNWSRLSTAHETQYSAATEVLVMKYGADRFQPALDLAMAELEHAHKKTSIQITMAYCAAYARCFPSKPTKETFEGCYAVFSDKD
jgi:hypothetical protein